MLCTSQASTAICLSMDEASSSSSSIQLGGRAIDRHNPIIRDQKRIPRGGGLPAAPCSSSSAQPPIDPKKTSNNNDSKGKKISSSSSSSSIKSKSSSGKSSSGSAKPLEYHRLVAPLRDSSRYLLSETAFFDDVPEYDPVLTMVTAEAEHNKITSISTEVLTNPNELISSKPSSSQSDNSSDSPPSRPTASDQALLYDYAKLHYRSIFIFYFYIIDVVAGGGVEGVPALQRL